jgi:hypothetical protein
MPKNRVRRPIIARIERLAASRRVLAAKAAEEQQ